MGMISKRIAGALVGVLVAGCALGPDFNTPDAPKVEQYSSVLEHPSENRTAAGPELKRGGQIPEQWWRVYGSTELNGLIRQGMQQSPTLAAARATLRAAQEDYASQSGTILYPTVDASVRSDRQKLSGASFGQNGDFIYSLHTASVSVSYAFDPFGSGRRYLESLRAQVDYQGFQMEAANLTLAANIVTTVISEASLRGQWQAASDIVKNRRAQLKIVERQSEIGVVTEADVLSQRTALAQAETALPPLEKQLAQTQHQLSVLVGRFPGGRAGSKHDHSDGKPGMPAFELAGLHLPESLPVSLPSELVHQRPDIRAAEAQLHQASALIGLATANMYPSLQITAGFGRQAVQFSNLLTGPASGIWSIGSNVLQPLFHGGELSAKRRQALASFDAARAQYQQTVLLAFRDVADVLLALQSDARGLKLQLKAESLARQTQDLVQHQFNLGAASFLTLLNAQQQYRQSHIGVVQARATLLADSAALFQAMGGGWWQRDNAYRPVAGNADFFKAWTGITQTEKNHGQE
jgi:NodT family efflux transporter outer membrane factor (OMF) lipoprotein